MTHSMDLTRGDMKQELISITIPLIIGNILQQLYNTIDAIVIGRYVGDVAFAAIGVAGTVMNLFIFVLSGFCAGISVVLGQLFGKEDMETFRTEFYLSTVFGVGFTALISICGIAFAKPLLHLIQTPADVAEYCYQYLVIIFAGLFASYLYNLCSAVLRAVGNTRAALVILAVSIVINLALALLFVGSMHTGVVGAALATVISQLISVLLSFLYIRIQIPDLMFRRADIKYDQSLMKKTVNFGSASAFHQSSLYIGKLLVQGAVNSMGIDMISAYTATTRIEGFINSFGDSGAASTSILIAQNKGAENEKRVQEGLRTSLVMMTVLGIVLSILMAATAGTTVFWMLGSTEGKAFDYAVQYMQVVSIFYILNYIGSAFVGYYRGVGMIYVPVIGTTLHITIRVILSYLFVQTSGLSAVAYATGIGWIVVTIYQAVVYVTRIKKIRFKTKAEE